MLLSLSLDLYLLKDLCHLASSFDLYPLKDLCHWPHHLTYIL